MWIRDLILYLNSIFMWHQYTNFDRDSTLKQKDDGIKGVKHTEHGAGNKHQVG